MKTRDTRSASTTHPTPPGGAHASRSSTTAVAALLVAALSLPAAAQVTSRVSVATGGAQGNAWSETTHFGISPDGRYVTFSNLSTNLVPGDTNGRLDVFVHDRQSVVTSRVSIASDGTQANQDSVLSAISADGRYVAFESLASNLVTGDTNGFRDIFVHDRQSAVTSRISVATNGTQANSACFYPSMSADGRHVAFWSAASSLVAGDTLAADVFVHDRTSGTTARVSVDTAGGQANGNSLYPSISADGRYVAFESNATDLVAVDANGSLGDVFVHDLTLGVTILASVGSSGSAGNGGCERPSISADGSHVAFASWSNNLVPGDTTNGWTDIFVRDLANSTTTRVSAATGGAQPNAYSYYPSISADGRRVAFTSLASNLVGGDTNGVDDTFVHDLPSGVTSRVSVSTSGAQGAGPTHMPEISSDGRYVAFVGGANDLVPGDTNGGQDTYVHDRDASGFASFCEPGVGGVIACACSNAPSGPGRGCENSAATGGAVLTAAGGSYVSQDSLTFTTSGQTPSEMSIVLQGNATLPAGQVFGQGVRCIGGPLVRLYVKTASAGSITAPDSGAGEPSVSMRSAALGHPIQPGQSTYYSVYYRDPIVLSGCPAASTFNATQSGAVGWWP